MKKKLFLGIIAASLLLLTSGCGILANGKEQTSTIKIEKDKAKELELELKLGAGELTVVPGADEWVEGTIEYRDRKYEPDVTYKLKGTKGTAVIQQNKKGNNINFGKIKNIWELSLTNKIPLNLTINSGASDTNIDLKGLKISGLEVNAGVGDITIDLGGNWEESFNASLALGVGETTVILPKEIGVKIDSSKGIGSSEFVGLISKGDGIYVNEAYEDAEVIIHLTTDLGVGGAIFKVE
ncbi:toast rack family protein [Bacillus sp. MRMR6]|uniref:toast rack family protein n=1 Tax=Bacillus sp. MRMR6 TaxID=1928617 RepID=UPI0009530392|nr:toast rack family protein [Bacillus sp. MRMR6]OLS38514.1 hypothetical protein BTR25_13915 [Bacillus sp. MRMR6]